MRGKKPTAVILVALAAMVTMAIGAASAPATVVTSTKQENVTITQSVQEPGFVLANAYAEEAIQCKKASAVIDVPEAGLNGTTLFNNNINRGPNEGVPSPVGAQSTGSGSVTMDLVNPPSFEECAIYALVGPNEWAETPVSLVVTTSGGWSVAATENDETEKPAEAEPASLAIVVPPNSAKVAFTVGENVCTITVSPEQASAVNGDYTNPTETTPGTLRVDGQLEDSSVPPGCGGPSPAQFEAEYEANNNLTIVN